MSVRKRMWTTAKGAKQTARIVDYADREGDRHIFCFGRDNHRCMSVQDTAASGGISGRRSITLSTKPKSLAISAVRK